MSKPESEQGREHDEIELTPEDDAALDAACDEVGAAALRELGCSEERIREIQAMRPVGDQAGDARRREGAGGR